MLPRIRSKLARRRREKKIIKFLMPAIKSGRETEKASV
jgi:hypothetical protein